MSEDAPEPKVTISIDVEAGIDEDWQDCGLDAAPASAEELLALLKSENESVYDLIRDWDLLTHVTVTIQVQRQTKPGKWETTTARWDG